MEQEMDIQNLEHELKIYELQLREKDQENRLAELKLKELKRSVRHRSLRPILPPSSPQQRMKDRHSIKVVGNTNKSHRIVNKNQELTGS